MRRIISPAIVAGRTAEFRRADNNQSRSAYRSEASLAPIAFPARRSLAEEGLFFSISSVACWPGLIESDNPVIEKIPEPSGPKQSRGSTLGKLNWYNAHSAAPLLLVSPLAAAAASGLSSWFTLFLVLRWATKGR